MEKEAKARIKINRLLEKAGWRFFENQEGPATIQLEANVKITESEINRLGDDFEKTKNGYIDFLLLDNSSRPLVVLEAKNEGKDPLDGKEQARRYASNQNVRFIILSNGNAHYFWDLEHGNPSTITEFPTQESLTSRVDYTPSSDRLADEKVEADYIALTQNPNFKDDPLYRGKNTREKYLAENNLRILRPYQLAAVHALQQSAESGNERYLFEMATGTGKTLIAAAIIKLFLRTGNAKRVLFLVDRIELEKQASKSFEEYLSNDYLTVIYKQMRDDWKKAEVVVSTVQSLSLQSKYSKLFSPTDFDLLIADESHRSINGNARAVFEYFVGYKLGLTATPKDYLRKIDEKKLSIKDPRALERRQLLDTYETFGCKSGDPTYRYSLIDGVRDNHLINPVVVDARTRVTTQLLSDKGYTAISFDDAGNESEGTFYQTDFEKRFFSENTNKVLCKAFVENAMLDPLSGEIGKSIVFAVSQNHAAKLTRLLNDIADKRWPGKYNSDFALQVTSNIPDAQQHPVKFANDNLNGHTRFLEGYKSSKTRVCVTVGMMTTGYDCPNILNLALMRPIFSPSDFVQIKGRGTRKHTFQCIGETGEKHTRDKSSYKLLDFFANCEYFEEKFDYDEVLELPAIAEGDNKPGTGGYIDEVEIFDPDYVQTVDNTQIGGEGMRVDRELFANAQQEISQDADIKAAIEKGEWSVAVKILREKYENKPKLYLTLAKICKGENIDRPLTWREVLERIFGFIDRFKSKDEKLEDECAKFISIHKPESKYITHIKNFLKAYIGDPEFRRIIDTDGDMHHYDGFSFEEYRALNGWRDIVPEYARSYVSFNDYVLPNGD